MRIRVELVIEMSDQQVSDYHAEYGVTTTKADVRRDVKETLLHGIRGTYLGENFFTSVDLVK